MPLTKQQLLIPRVLCIGTKEGEPNFPGSMVKTDEILTLCTGITNGRYYESKDGHLIHLPLNYPNCFKPLPWWYGRTESELPEYLIDKVGKVKRVLDYNTGFMTVVFSVDDFEESLAHYQPADLSDYQEYQKQKESI